MDKFAEVDPLATDAGLYTSSGEFVVWVILPPFKTVPGSITWGDRMFILDKENGRYLEGFNYVVPNVSRLPVK